MFGVRLKEERKRLGLTQPQLAEVVGSAKRTVIDWEKDKSSPTAIQLTAMINVGVDTNYLLTGKRTEPSQIPADELFLLDSYRKLPEDRKKMALQFLIGGFDGLTEEKKIQEVVGSPNSKFIGTGGFDSIDNKGYINQGSHKGDVSFGKT